MEQQIYTVENLDSAPRKYKEPRLGGFVIVQPGETVETLHPPEPMEFWKIEQKGRAKEKPKEDD